MNLINLKVLIRKVRETSLSNFDELCYLSICKNIDKNGRNVFYLFVILF